MGIMNLVRDWRVSNETSDSDHRQIRFALQRPEKTEDETADLQTGRVMRLI